MGISSTDSKNTTTTSKYIAVVASLLSCDNAEIAQAHAIVCLPLSVYAGTTVASYLQPVPAESQNSKTP